MKSVLAAIVAIVFTGCASEPHYDVKLEWHGPTPPPIVIVGETEGKTCVKPTKPLQKMDPCPPTRETIHRIKWGPFTVYRDDAPDPLDWKRSSVIPKPADHYVYKTDWTGKVTKDYQFSAQVDTYPRLMENGRVELEQHLNVNENDHEEPATPVTVPGLGAWYGLGSVGSYSYTGATTRPYSGRYGTTPLK